MAWIESRDLYICETCGALIWHSFMDAHKESHQEDTE